MREDAYAPTTFDHLVVLELYMPLTQEGGRVSTSSSGLGEIAEGRAPIADFSIVECRLRSSDWRLQLVVDWDRRAIDVQIDNRRSNSTIRQSQSATANRQIGNRLPAICNA